MHLEQLMGKYRRLRAELDAAYGDGAWDTRRIDRIADEIAATERELAQADSQDEQTSDWIPGLFVARDD